MLSDKTQSRLISQTPSQPKEGLLKVVIRSSRDVVVLKISFSMELNVLRFNLSLLNVDFITDEDDGDVVTDTSDITMPVWDIFISDTRSDIKHDNSTFAFDTESSAEKGMRRRETKMKRKE